MIVWMRENSWLLDLGANLLMTAIWLVYLQLFLSSLMRQRRSAILINTGVGVGMDARCFISNLGYEPIYLSDVLVRLVGPGGTTTSVITDRSELSVEELNDPDEATNQGPLRSGHTTDIGSFDDLVERARKHAGKDLDPHSIEGLELVVAAHTASRRLIGGSRAFALDHNKHGIRMRPRTLHTRQIRGRLSRRKLERELQELVLK